MKTTLKRCKPLLSLALALLVALASMPFAASPAIAATVVSSQPLNGSGASDSPYELSTASELLWFAEQVNGGNRYIYARLTADIDMSPLCSPKNGSWAPINGDYYATFDGNFHEIKNLYINNPTEDYQGLFGSPDRATIKNLGVTDCNIIGNNYVGGIVGSSSYTVVQHCFVTGSVTGQENVGGIYGSLGMSEAYDNISAATVSGNVNAG